MPVLQHPTNYAQKTFYDCGPASLVVALAARGVSISESLAAVEAGTTTSGTATILDIIRVLDKHLGAGTYRAVWIPGNAATPEQVAQLRADLVASVDAGYALVANVVGTATTADGSEVNSYPGGHYLAPVGYDSGGDRAWIVDVADGHEYWMTTQALADWIASRGYATVAEGADVALTDIELARIALYVQQGSDDRGYPPDSLPKPVRDALRTMNLAAQLKALQTQAVDVDALAAAIAGNATLVEAIAKAVNDDAAARLAQ